MSPYTYRSVNLTGVQWPTKDGADLVGFSSGRPGFGVQCVETGRLLSRDGTSPHPVSAKRFVADETAADTNTSQQDPRHTWVTVRPPRKRSHESHDQHRALWSARQNVWIYKNGVLEQRFRNADLVSAWIVASAWFTPESRAEGYRAVVTPAHTNDR